MSERVSYDILQTASAGYVTRQSDTATIGKDPAKGITEDVAVPFDKPVFNVTDKDQASEAFNLLGADVFNGLLNYAADLKSRARVVSAKRAELSGDPLKAETKPLAKLGFTDAQIEKYAAARASGSSRDAALASILS